MSGDEVKRRRPKRPSNYDLVARDFTATDLPEPAEEAYWCANFRCTGSGKHWGELSDSHAARLLREVTAFIITGLRRTLQWRKDIG
jgi:hypothetical protein